MTWWTVLARIRVPVLLAGLAFLFLGGFASVPLIVRVAAVGALNWVVVSVGGAPGAAPLTIGPPLAGRWQAHNSPASRVPSHGVHLHGQTYAIDFAAEIDVADDGRQTSRSNEPSSFVSFGCPVSSGVHGVVRRARQGAEDHAARTATSARVTFPIESLARGLLGGRFLIGNHVVIEAEDGSFLLFAHLRNGSLKVEEGDTVAPTTVVAEVGNTGNTTQPHLHIQRMDHPSPLFAAGLPFLIAGSAELPPNGQVVEL